MKNINYPYQIPNKHYKYVGIENRFMQEAMFVAEEGAFKTGYEPKTPVGVVFVKDDTVLISASNGSDYHQNFGCERKRLNIPSGQNYELCPGCDYENHAEPKAIQMAKKRGIDLTGSDVYLFGEWWCCKPCSDKMLSVGVQDIFLLEDSDILFNRDLKTSRNIDFDYFKALIAKK